MTAHQQHILGVALGRSMFSAFAASPVQSQQAQRFAQAFAVTPERLAAWLDLAARAGSSSQQGSP